MLIILAIFLTTTLANSHEKYIDLLPEEDKEEFLNTVARRILKTVETTENGDKSSRELTEEELNGHNKFVQDVLKEESERMRNRREDDRNSDDEKNASENLEVKPLNLEITENDNSDKIHKSSDSKDAHLSANIKRRSIDDAIQESSTDYIKVEIVTENIQPFLKRSVNTDGESSEPKYDLGSKKTQEEEMIITKFNTISTSNSDFRMQTEEPKHLEPNIEFQDETETEYKVPVGSGDENNSHSNDESESKPTEAIPSIENNNSSTLNSTIAESETQTPKPHLEAENKSVINSSNVEAILATTDEYLGEYSTMNPKASDTLTSSLTDEGTTDIFIDLISYMTTTESAALNKYSTHSANAFKSSMATTVNYGEVLENKIPKIAIKTSVLTTTGTPVLTPANIEVKTTEKPKKKIKIKKNSENTTLISYFASNALKKSKSEYDLKNGKLNFNKKYEAHANLHPYQVYEIPWPNSTEDKPFLRNPEPIQDQPNYVPVYKYSPNYAYYNPTNRRGPNAVEENSIELETNNLREGKNTGKKPETNEFILQLNDELRKFGVYKQKPLEYAEETVASTTPSQDSSEERNTVMHLPDSDEKLHPSNSMQSGLKSHIRAIRDILYKKQIYNHSPVKKKEYIEHLYGNTDILDKYPTTIDFNDEKTPPALRAHHFRDRAIDIDYYFGRMKRLNDKTKDLQRLQGQSSPEMNDINELLIMNHGHDKLNDDRANPSKKDITINEHSNFSTITKILGVTDEKDVFINLDKLQQLNLNLMRRNEDVKVGIYMKVLKDLIEQDSKGLKQYNWLATTVQIQSALEKLFKLILQKKNYKPIHPADIQILKYAIFIHNFALEVRGANQLKSKLRKVKLLPRGKNKKKSKVIKEKGLINRVWLYLRTLLPDLGADDELNNLHEFLSDVANALYDLHEAITNIAKITKFKQQNWFENIKEIYLTSDEKHLRELLLHISFSRLIDLIEHSCENGLENDFIQYMKTNKKESKRTLEEVLFVLKILNEIKYNLE